MSTPLDDLIAASAPRDTVPSVVDSSVPDGAGASFYDGESISLPASGGGNCYAVYSIILIERPEELCGGLLKNNETACIKPKRKCHCNHRGEGKLGFNGPTVAVLARHKETIFSVPILNAAFLDVSLLNKWRNTKKTKLDWNKCFDTVQYLFEDPNHPITLTEYEKQVRAQDTAKRALKTPGKPRGPLFPQIDDAEEEEIHFRPVIKLERNTTSGETPLEKIKQIEAYLIQEGESNEERWQAVKRVLQDNASTSKYHTTQINSIDTLIGVRNPRSFPNEFDNADIWSTIGSIGQAVLDQTKPSVEALTAQIQERCLIDFKSQFTEMEQFNRFVNHLTTWFDSYHENKASVWARLSALESSRSAPQGHFFNQFQGVHSSFMNQPQQSGEINAVQGPTLKEHRDLKDEVDKLKATILKMSLEKDQVSIKFGSLGFTSVADARAFVSEYPDARNFGLVIDPYAVCYHVMKDKKGHKMFFDRLQHIKKLGIGTNREAIVMHGFNSPIPELFDDSGEHFQSSPYTSSFSKFPTHKDWLDKGKVQISDGIKLVRSQLNQHADNFLRPGSKVHTICKLSISESCAAMEQFCTWLNKSHNNLVTYGMSKDKAWILTTKLGERVFRELFTVRSGVADGFNVCGEDTTKLDIAANVWFYVPKTLDVLKTFMDADFGNHESIAGEYIRFLVHNTNSSEVSTFQADINKLDERINSSKKHWDKEFKSVMSTAEGANKAATSFHNKLTEQNKKLKEWASNQFASK